MVCREGTDADYVHILTAVTCSVPQLHSADRMMLLISLHHFNREPLLSQTGLPRWADMQLPQFSAQDATVTNVTNPCSKKQINV